MRESKLFEHNGEKLTFKQICGLNPRLNPSTVRTRLYQGKSVAEAIEPRVSLQEAGRRGKEATKRAGYGGLASR
jgi:hypothetical protein